MGGIARNAGCLAIAAALAGCAAGGQFDTGNFFVQPGKYQFLKCPDLQQRYAAASAREKELAGLMERAGDDVVGRLVGVTTYEVDLRQARADAQLLQQTMQEKGCTNMVPTRR